MGLIISIFFLYFITAFIIKKIMNSSFGQAIYILLIGIAALIYPFLSISYAFFNVDFISTNNEERTWGGFFLCMVAITIEVLLIAYILYKFMSKKRIKGNINILIKIIVYLILFLMWMFIMFRLGFVVFPNFMKSLISKFPPSIKFHLWNMKYTGLF